MAVRSIQEEKDSVFFCTITCYDWLPLFQQTDFYSEIYKWFDLSGKKSCHIYGYVIMPNHLHFLIYIPKSVKNLNTLISNGKRFMAYEIISRLNKQGNYQMLKTLRKKVSEKDGHKGQLHRVFRSSFDSKPCYSEEFILQKLDYMHHNPVSGKWNMVEDFTDYLHSSAKFYELNTKGVYKITHYKNFTG